VEWLGHGALLLSWSGPGAWELERQENFMRSREVADDHSNGQRTISDQCRSNEHTAIEGSVGRIMHVNDVELKMIIQVDVAQLPGVGDGTRREV
jgi:hypothetical protein